jgi:hypothetical protein
MYRDDDAAMAIDREEHMLKWMEDDAQNLWIDRYDVRSVSIFSKLQRCLIETNNPEQI